MYPSDTDKPTKFWKKVNGWVINDQLKIDFKKQSMYSFQIWPVLYNETKELINDLPVHH